MYIAGAVFGSLVFGLLAGTWASFKAVLDARLKSVSVALCADKYGRKKFFVVTPAIILCSSFATAFSWDYYSFLVCNFFTGIGIGAPLPGQPRAEAAI